MQRNSHIAIVGCGFSGTSAFHQLVERYPASEISLFEASGDFGPGYAYRTDECPDYLINNTTDSMCLTPSSGRAFYEWLKQRPQLAADLDPKGHLPRCLFGKFLQDAFREAKERAAAKGIKVNCIPHEVIDMDEADDGRVHVTWIGGELWVDKIIMSTGRCPNTSPVEEPTPESSAHYIASHIMTDEIDAVALDATIHILGASLSAYDVVNRLFSPATGSRFLRNSQGRLGYQAGSNGRRVVLCSRSGRLKAIQPGNPLAIKRRHFTADFLRARAAATGLDLQAVAACIRAESKAHNVSIDWPKVADPYVGCFSEAEVSRRAAELLSSVLESKRSDEDKYFLVELFSDAQLDLWDAFGEQLLSAAEERRYREEFETAALAYMAPCPIPTAEKLLALHEAGCLRVIKGVKKPMLADDGSYFALRHDFGLERATVMINTTGGTNRDLSSAYQPQLIRGLVRRGKLESYSRGGESMPGAAVNMSNYLAKGSRSIYVANMLLWGPGIFTSSARMMARVVERIVDDLIQNLR